MSLKVKVVLAGLLLCMIPGLVRAKVMLVVSSDDPYYSEVAAGFKKSFGQPVEEYNLLGLEDESRKLGKGLAASKPELLIAVGNLSAKMAKEYCADCQILYAAASNASERKLSGATVYGISAQPSAAKTIDSIKLVFPNAQKVGLIYNAAFTGKDVSALQAAAGKAGLKLIAEPITQMKDIPTTLTKLIPQIDLYLMLDDPGVVSDDTFPFIFLNCFQKKIPIFATSQEILKKCGIAGYGYNPAQLGSELGKYAADIMAQKPGGKERVASAKLFLNKKIAQMYNYSFPDQAASQGTIVQ
jgi:putative tryptophan/tyrosine transport system substrate-binding protein